MSAATLKRVGCVTVLLPGEIGFRAHMSAATLKPNTLTDTPTTPFSSAGFRAHMSAATLKPIAPLRRPMAGVRDSALT